MEKVAIRRRIYPNGSVTIPKDIKEILNVEIGTEVEFYVDKDKEAIILKPVDEN